MPFYRDTHMYLQECLGQGSSLYRHETFAKQFFVQKTGSGSAACWVAFRSSQWCSRGTPFLFFFVVV